jgi:MFS superfamily sulfate permease-like transporter
VFFANYMRLKQDLATLPRRKTVTFDLSEAATVDHTVMEFLHQFCEAYNREGGHAEISGLDWHLSSSEHPLAPRRKVA